MQPFVIEQGSEKIERFRSIYFAINFASILEKFLSGVECVLDRDRLLERGISQNLNALEGCILDKRRLLESGWL